MLTLGLVALALIVMATLWLNERAQMQLTESVRATELRKSAEGLRSALLAAEGSQRGYLLTGNEIYLSPYDTAHIQALEELEKIRLHLGVQMDSQRLVEDLSRAVTGRLHDLKTTIALKSRRQESDALSIINSNMGKSLMDEASVYLNGISLDADEKVAAGIREQSHNTNWMRLVSLLAALMIAAVSTVIGIVVRRYAMEILAARNAVAAANETLENRVAQRTAELSKAKDYAETLLGEVNHRVSNSLALVVSLIRLQLRTMEDNVARRALEQTEGRIQAIAQMHRLLFTSGQVGEVSLDQYLGIVMDHLGDTLMSRRDGIRLSRDFDHIKLNSREAINFGIIATEWVTNAFKYAYPGSEGEIRLRLTSENADAILTIEDDGIGRAEDAPIKGTGLGTKVVHAIAMQMNGSVEYRARNPGFQARLRLPQTGMA